MWRIIALVGVNIFCGSKRKNSYTEVAPQVQKDEVKIGAENSEITTKSLKSDESAFINSNLVYPFSSVVPIPPTSKDLVKEVQFVNKIKISTAIKADDAPIASLERERSDLPSCGEILKLSYVFRLLVINLDVVGELGSNFDEEIYSLCSSSTSTSSDFWKVLRKQSHTPGQDRFIELLAHQNTKHLNKLPLLAHVFLNFFPDKIIPFLIWTGISNLVAETETRVSILGPIKMSVLHPHKMINSINIFEHLPPTTANDSQTHLYFSSMEPPKYIFTFFDKDLTSDDGLKWRKGLIILENFQNIWLQKSYSAETNKELYSLIGVAFADDKKGNSYSAFVKNGSWWYKSEGGKMIKRSQSSINNQFEAVDFSSENHLLLFRLERAKSL